MVFHNDIQIKIDGLGNRYKSVIKYILMSAVVLLLLTGLAYGANNSSISKQGKMLPLSMNLTGGIPMQETRAGPFYNSANDHYYEIVTTPITWSEALKEAQASTYLNLTGHLATITSQEESDFISPSVNQFYCLGGYQPPGSFEPDGGWIWITGEPWGYNYWYPGQPDNSNGENVLEFYWSGYWNDFNSDNQQSGYVIEYDNLTETTPPDSITNLTNTTAWPTIIDWVWDEPDTSDYYQVMVYIDGVFKANVTKGKQWYNATGLTPDIRSYDQYADAWTIQET